MVVVLLLLLFSYFQFHCVSFLVLSHIAFESPKTCVCVDEVMPKRWKTFQRLDSFDYANDSRNVQKKTTTNKHKHTNYTVYVLPNKTNELNIRCVQCVHPVLFALQCTHSGSVFLVEKHSMHFYVLAICVISFGHGLCAIRCRSSSLAAVFFIIISVFQRNVCNCNSSAWVQFMWQKRQFMCIETSSMPA